MSLPYRFSLALVISCMLHMLILWLTGHYRIDAKNSRHAPQHKTLHLSLSSATPPVSDAITQSSSTAKPNRVETEKTEARRSSAPGKTTLPEKPPGKRAGGNASQPVTDARPAVTAARIRATAKEEAHASAEETSSETGSIKPTLATKLQRILNPTREPPGVRKMADGTLRVVTGFGTIYCIRPREDWRILGPEDNLSVTVTCR